MASYTKHRKTVIAEMREVTPELLDSNYPFHVVSISDADKQKGSPKVGDMIARNPENHDDKWLVEKEFYEANYESVAEQDTPEELNIGQMSSTDSCEVKKMWIVGSITRLPLVQTYDGRFFLEGDYGYNEISEHEAETMIANEKVNRFRGNSN